MGTGDPVQMLTTMNLALGSGSESGFTGWTDTFEGGELSDVWTQAAWADAVPKVIAGADGVMDDTLESGAAVRDALSIDADNAYSVGLFIMPYDGANHGKHRIAARMDADTPDVTQDGILAELVMEGDDGAATGSLKVYVGGVETEYSFSAYAGDGSPAAGWFTVLVDGDNVKCYWRGTQLLSQGIASQDGTRVGFGLECTQEGGACWVDVFRVQYYTSVSAGTIMQGTVVVGSSGGKLYRDTTTGAIEEVVSDLDLLDDAQLSATQIGQKLYVADYGGLRAFGSDGSMDGDGLVLTATGVSDWSALSINTDTDVVVISEAQGAVTAGTYRIASVSEGGVTLDESAGGAGECSYRIARAPKVYDPLTDTLAVLEASEGQAPTGCPLVCRYRDRLVLAGDPTAPHVWYVSRQSDPTDWDYSQEDAQAAVAGTSSDAGVPGEPITALVPHSDDYLVLGCESSLWRLRGDPAYGGSLDNLSMTVGIVDRDAWCLTPEGDLVFLSHDGVYVLPPGGNGYPVALSREALPDELLDFATWETRAIMEFDTRGRGIHLFLTDETGRGSKHWWIDWTRKTFWPVELRYNHDPFATCAVRNPHAGQSGVILGGYDGQLRRFDESAGNDDGYSFDSYVEVGPLPLGDDLHDGVLIELNAVIAHGSGDVVWGVSPAWTYEGALAAASTSTGTWSAGRSYASRPIGRGRAFLLTLAGDGGTPWAVEKITAIVREAGRSRRR
jgi:hypothetical protein